MAPEATGTSNEIGPIALALSGGGYRAAGFHLGVLDILDRLGLSSELAALSTVSGGTIAGVRLIAGRVRPAPETFPQFFTALHRFLVETNVVERSLTWLDEHPQSKRSLIVGAASTYAATRFLGDDRLGAVINSTGSIPAEISFNATEFTSGLSFRFQRSRSGRAPIGNMQLSIPIAQAKQIRLADIVAASSCFPGAFEPFKVPDDLTPQPGGAAIVPVALMDGGIYDNQGIEAMLYCIERLKGAGTNIGLAAVSDTSVEHDSAFLEPVRDKQHHGLTIGVLQWMGGLASIAAAIAGISLWSKPPEGLGKLPLIALIAMLCVFALGLPVLWWWVNREIRNRLPTRFRSLWPFIKGMHLGDVAEFVDARLRSVMVMTSDIFMKRIRALTLGRLYQDDSLKGRRVVFLVYDLLEAANRGQVTKAQAEIGRLANAMPTTLWATKEELRTIIACGQNTACLKLLLHLEERERDLGDLSPRSTAIREQLKSLWLKLEADPYSLCDERLAAEP